MLANLSTSLNYSSDGINFLPSQGILTSDTVIAAEFYSSQNAFAVSGKNAYRSTNGGKNWFVILDTLHTRNSIYIDRTHSALYIGGSEIVKSIDSGATWQTLSSIFFIPTGPVIGVRDCSGTFYLAPDAATHGSLYRSIDQGRFFQEAGPAIFSSVALKKGVVLDRGSTIFWLDQSGLIGVVRDGIDSVVSDSVADRVIIQPDSSIRNSLCNNAPPTQFGVSVSYDQCTGIILDSLKQIGANSSFSAKFNPGFLGDTASIRISFTYRATHAGFDTAHYRLKFHSSITGNIEQKFFDLIALGIAGSPDISLSENELDFPATGLDSMHKLTVTITNSGCDTLLIDTMTSTNPAIFIPDLHKFPTLLAPGKNIQETVSFNPHLSGDYLESLDIETNIGARFITLRGTGKTTQTNYVYIPEEGNEIRVYPNPVQNDVCIWSTHSLPKNIFIRDLLGKEIMQLQTGEERMIIYHLHSLTAGIYILDFGDGKFERIVLTH